MEFQNDNTGQLEVKKWVTKERVRGTRAEKSALEESLIAFLKSRAYSKMTFEMAIENMEDDKILERAESSLGGTLSMMEKEANREILKMMKQFLNRIESCGQEYGNKCLNPFCLRKCITHFNIYCHCFRKECIRRRELIPLPNSSDPQGLESS